MSVFRIIKRQTIHSNSESDLVIMLNTPFKYMIPYDRYLNYIYINKSNYTNSNEIYKLDVLIDGVTLKTFNTNIQPLSHIYKLECFGFYIKKGSIISINANANNLSRNVYTICYFNKQKIECEDFVKETILSVEEILNPDQSSDLDSLLS